jgi:Mg-chelatase subunit ChlD
MNMPFHRIGFLCFVLCALVLVGPALSAEPTLLMTADTAGHIEPCDQCPTGRNQGGLARRATLIERLRGEHAPTVLLDSGGMLFGGGGGASRANALTQFYNELKYTALNIGYRDFRKGKAATLSALESADFAVLSANLHDADSGERLFRPYTMQSAGDQQLAIIGATEKPAALAALPHLKKQLAGITVAAPGPAIAEAVNEAKNKADKIVLLYYGSAGSMREAVKPVADQLDAVLLAGADGASSISDSPLPLVTALRHGKGVTQLSLEGDAEAISHVVEPTLTPETEIAKRVAEQLEAEAKADAKKHGGSASLRPTLPHPMPAEGQVKLAAHGENRGLSIDVRSAQLMKKLGDRTARKGHRLLVLDTAWTDQIALDLIFELEYPEQFLVASVRRQCYLLINGTRVQRLVEDASKLPGHLPAAFTLGRVGAVAQGRLVYEVPAEGVDSLSLRYYHDQYAPIDVPLLTAGEDEQADRRQPIAGPKSNNIGTFAVYGVGLKQQYKGRTAPPGLQYAVVDVRAKSEIGIQADALALRKDAPPDKKVRLAKVMEYLKAPRLLQMLVDGEYVALRVPGLSTLLPNPALLPDVMAGGKAVFLVPRQFDSLELACGFPRYKKSAGGDLGYPEPLRFALKGEPVEPAARTAISVVNDKPIPFAVMDRTLTQQHGPLEAEAEQKLLVLSVSMKNISDEGGMFNVRSRVDLRLADGGKGTLKAVTSRGGAPLGEPIWLGAKQRRSYELVFSIPASSKNATLGYAGVSVAGSIDLRLDQDIDLAKNQEAEPGPGNEPKEADTTTSKGSTTDQPSDENNTQKAEAASTDEKPAQPTQAVFDKALGTLPEQSAPSSAIKAGQRREVNAQARNDLVELTVESIAIKEKIADEEPRHGNVYVVLQTRWKNLRPIPEPKEGEGQAYPPTYHVKDLRDQLYCVYNAKRLLPITFLSEAEDHLPNRLRVPWEDQQVRYDEDKDKEPLANNITVGSLVYQVPKGALKQLDLHLLDGQHGNIELPVLEPADGRLRPKPVRAMQRNRLVEMGVFNFQRTAEFRRDDTNDDQTWVTVDLRGRSLAMTNPEPAEDDAAEQAPPPKRGRMFRWRNWRDYVHLIIDGRIARFNPRRGDTWIRHPRVIPAATAGGRIGFKVRQALLDNAQSVELYVGFPIEFVPGVGNIRPKAMMFNLAGERPERPDDDPAARVDDMDGVVEAVKPFEFADAEKRDDWSNYHIYQFRVTANEKRGTFFTPETRLGLVGHQGKRREPSYYSRDLPLKPPRGDNPFWVPAGEQRVFQLAWKKVKGADKPLLYYDGILRSRPVLRLNQPPEAPLNAPAQLATAGDAVIHPDREPVTIQDAGMTAKQVNSAIDRGRAYLWSKLKDKTFGKRGKYELPMILAMVHADAHEDIPAFDRKLRDFLDRVRPNKLGSHSTYKTGLLAMILEGYGDPAYMERMKEVAHYLVEDQGPDGMWDYNAHVPDELFAPVPEEKETSFQVTGGRSLAEPDLPDQPIARTQSWHVNDDGDNSVSQFAMLGLWSAERAGIEIDDEVWRLALRAQLGRQNENDAGWPRGWGYNYGGAYGSMTGAGLCMTALAMHHLDEDLDPKQDARIQGALKWLVDRWTVEKNPKAGNSEKKWIYYYVYSLERVGQILGIEYVGDHHWYTEGAKWLISQQAGNGSWSGRSGDHNPKLATSFALLFLTRATPELDAESSPIPRGGDGRLKTAADMPERDHNVYLILDASGSMLGKLGNQTKFDAARSAVNDVIDLLPPNTRAALRVYGHRRTALEDGANQDTELVIPWQKLDKAAFRQALDRISPRGKTPLALSLEEAAGDLGGASGSGESLVILLTDGGEDTRPPRDPTKPAKAFGQNDNLQLYVVGFDIQRPAWRKQLRGIAEAGKGQYLPVNQAGALARRLEAVVYPKPPAFAIANDAGETLRRGRFGDTIELPEGHYTLHTRQGNEPTQTSFWINTNSTTRVNYDVKALPDERRTLANEQPSEAQASQEPDKPQSQAGDNQRSKARSDARSDDDGPNFCTNCGQKLQAGAKFCTNCGQKIGR